MYRIVEKMNEISKLFFTNSQAFLKNDNTGDCIFFCKEITVDICVILNVFYSDANMKLKIHREENVQANGCWYLVNGIKSSAGRHSLR